MLGQPLLSGNTFFSLEDNFMDHFVDDFSPCVFFALLRMPIIWVVDILRQPSNFSYLFFPILNFFVSLLLFLEDILIFIPLSFCWAYNLCYVFSRAGFLMFLFILFFFFMDTIFFPVFHSILKRDYFEYSPCRVSVPFKFFYLFWSLSFILEEFLRCLGAPWLIAPLGHMTCSSSKISVPHSPNYGSLSGLA